MWDQESLDDGQIKINFHTFDVSESTSYKRYQLSDYKSLIYFCDFWLYFLQTN